MHEPTSARTRMEMSQQKRREGSEDLPVLVWRLAAPARVISTAPYGGGIGVRQWVINAQVPSSYGRLDPGDHLHQLSVLLGLTGQGVGMLTAADVGAVRHAADDGVTVAVTVGLDHPTWAAAPDENQPVESVGTINLVAWVPEPLTDAALVNAVATVVEAKVQALGAAGVDGTGTATDAVVVACPNAPATHAFGGPRSRWGAPLARAAYAAILAGAR